LTFLFDDGSLAEEDEEEGGGIEMVSSCFLLLLIDFAARIAPDFGVALYQAISDQRSAISDQRCLQIRNEARSTSFDQDWS
jgi:hypothetical protein